MKKLFKNLLLFPVLATSITGCNSNNNNSKTDISYKPAVVSKEEANKIKGVYLDMVEDFSEQTNKNANNKNINGLAPLRATNNSNESDFNVTEMGPDALVPFMNDFIKLKNLVTEDFANYCNQFNPLVVDEVVYNAKASIYEETEQFALILQYKNIYVFFSNFYFDDDLNKHFEKENDSYQFSFNAAILAFSASEGKVDFPIKVGSYSNIGDISAGGDEFVINNETELEDADARNAYSSIKYPFLERFYSNEILALVNSKSRSLEDHDEFIKLSEEEIYLTNKTGKFDIDGANYHGEIIDISINDNTITFGSEFYNITTYSPRIFLMDKMKLTLRITEGHYVRTLVERKNEYYIYDEEMWYVDKYYIISEFVEITKTGVRYKLMNNIDTMKPYYIDDQYLAGANVNRLAFNEEKLLDEVVISTDYLNEQMNVTYIKGNEQFEQFEQFVMLPNIN